ncbi:ABC transporter permease [Niabella beijingensis]|uniref:ABC transporter permease n=1 Tax=Niabella beijingensis TaxID=2872700 RepID=UPI001CBC4B93|nr:FtsX-like permease family protein [Niabella beijingensis]MBZ4188626.1 ABC transporter permease [Niabella beijingensis]
MNTASFIAHRIAFNKQRSFSRFIIRLSVIATAISVAVMIITLAFANGFQQKVSEKVFSFWGHIRIQEMAPYQYVVSEEIPITASPALVAQIKKNPQVTTVQPFATRYAIVKTKDDLEGVLVKGVDSTYNFKNLQSFIRRGRPPVFKDSTYSREIMISEYTATQMKLDTGSRVLIYFIRPDNSLRPDRLTVTGIYKTGIEEYDKTFAIGDIRLIRRLNDWEPDQIGGYEIFLKDYKQIGAVSDELTRLPQMPEEWDAQDIKNFAPNIFDWLNMQDVTRNLLIAIMIVVAVINLITCLIILVLERMRMIGVLKAVGATDWTVQKIFLRHSLLITLSGIAAGAAGALGLLYVQVRTGFIKLDESAYYLSQAAVKISSWEVLAICAGTFLVCLLVLLIPTYIVKKVQVVKAIHFR